MKISKESFDKIIKYDINEVIKYYDDSKNTYAMYSFLNCDIDDDYVQKTIKQIDNDIFDFIIKDNSSNENKCKLIINIFNFIKLIDDNYDNSINFSKITIE